KGKGTSVHLVIGKLAAELDAIPWDGDDSPEESGDSSEEGDIDPILQPVKSGKKKVEPKKKVDVKIENSSDLVDAVLIAAERTEEDRQAKNQDNYAKRQIKGMNSSLEKIIKNWEMQNTKGIKTSVKNAIKKLERILDKL
ncbi:uncharacterized protein METZ01_LOCUS487263, partial [marine metagenome]